MAFKKKGKCVNLRLNLFDIGTQRRFKEPRPDPGLNLFQNVPMEGEKAGFKGTQDWDFFWLRF